MTHKETAATAPDLKSYDWIMVNSSAGKDSQTSLRQVVLEADRQGFPRDRIVVVHADLGETLEGNSYEWSGVPELAGRQAAHYGLRFEVVKRRKADGSSDSILEYTERRGAWPSSTVRFCTSEFKRTPCRRVITQLDREIRTDRKQQIRVLQVFGFRAEESPARAKKANFEHDKRSSTKTRHVDNWLPIQDWLEGEVWDDIKASGVEHHEAYDLGMPRLSCCFCIFAPREALLVAGEHNRPLLDEYVAVERRINHTFRQELPIAEIAAALDAGERAGKIEASSWMECGA